MKFNKNVFLLIAIIVIAIALAFMFTDVISPRNDIVQGSLEKSDSLQLIKTQNNNNYYVSFKQINKEIKLTCTKEQYDFMSNGQQIYILYKKNFFNRNKGTVLKVDNSPIDNSYRGM